MDSSRKHMLIEKTLDNDVINDLNYLLLLVFNRFLGRVYTRTFSLGIPQEEGGGGPIHGGNTLNSKSQTEMLPTPLYHIDDISGFFISFSLVFYILTLKI